uniref:Uncharacterized protein n=1 Tax=Cyprinus carpio TaxID=7962 RepID=A0A8C1QE04_CYPCA
MLNMSKQKSKTENAASRQTLPQTAEISREDNEGDACEQSSSTCPAKKKQKSGVRPYKDDFLKFGFVNCSDAVRAAIPMYVICGEKLANESLKPAKLERHLSTRHADLADKPLSFFQRKSEEIKSSAQLLSRSVTYNDKLHLASYKVSYRLAKEKAPHTIAERLILPAALDIVNTVLDEKASEKLKLIPLSDNTVSRRIVDIAQNLEEQLIARLKSARDFAIQLDESTNVASSAKLLVYVRYIWQGMKYLLFLLINCHLSKRCAQRIGRWPDASHSVTSGCTDGEIFSLISPGKFDELKDKRWVKNPFDFETPDSIAELNLTPSEESEMIQLTSDNTLKTRHKTEKLSSFWIGLFTEYPMLSKASISLLLPFTTTYMCETGSSLLTKMKTKQRNKLNASPDMRVALSSCEPAWDQIMQNKQAHPSH